MGKHCKMWIWEAATLVITGWAALRIYANQITHPFGFDLYVGVQISSKLSNKPSVIVKCSQTFVWSSSPGAALHVWQLQQQGAGRHAQQGRPGRGHEENCQPGDAGLQEECGGEMKIEKRRTILFHSSYTSLILILINELWSYTIKFNAFVFHLI